jgi:predicted MFS family arabinose efflux permease
MKMIAVLTISQLLLLIFHYSILSIGFSMWLFFTAFTLLEAILPSTVSKLAPMEYKGATLGLFSSCQFLGIFLGGIVGGWLFSQFQINGVFFGCLLFSLIWLTIGLLSNKQSTTIRIESPQ